MKMWMGIILLVLLMCVVGSINLTWAQDAECTVSAANDVNLRSGPGTNFDIAGVLSVGQSATVEGQTTGADRFVWWQLEDGSWVRSDVVNEQSDCEDIS